MGQRSIGGRERPRPAVVGAILALSLLWACGPLRAELLPAEFSGSLPQLAAQSMPLGLMAVLATAYALWRRAEWPHGKNLRTAAWIGLGLFAVPSLLIHLADGWVSALARTALFALVPVFSVVLDPYLGVPTAQPVPGGLPTALAALLGALLVFPVTVPDSAGAAGALGLVILAALCVSAANCYAVATFQRLAHQAAASTIAVVTLTGSLSLGFASASLERAQWRPITLAPELLWAAAVELPGLLLLFWLMRRLGAVPLATRFVLAPSLTIPIGAMLLQMPLAPRTWLGLLGMAGGAGYLLLAREPEAEPATLLGDSQPE